MPDGETLFGLSDETGEFEWVTLPADGVDESRARALTSDGTILRFQGRPSPDGRFIAYTDNNADLWVLNVQTRAQTRVSTDRDGVGAAYWSPDSRWLAFEQNAPNSFRQVRLYNVVDGSRADVTSDRVNSFSPAWSPDGDFLYFISDRNLRSVVGSPWGPRAPEPFFNRPNELFHVSLRPGLPSPFLPDNELTEEETGDDEGPGGRDRSGEENAEAEPVEIELDGLMERVKKIPVPAGNYFGLEVLGNALYFGDREPGSFGGGRLLALTIDNEDEPEIETVAEGISYFEGSADGRKILVRQGNNIFVVDARPSRISQMNDHRVDLSGWAFSLDVREDWRQLFIDA
jgi:tricorn protease